MKTLGALHNIPFEPQNHTASILFRKEMEIRKLTPEERLKGYNEMLQKAAKNVKKRQAMIKAARRRKR